MRKHHPPHLKLITIGGELRIIEMKVELRAFVVGAFAQKQVGAVAELHQLVVPSGVAGKDDRLAAGIDSKRKRNVGLGMRTANRVDLELAETRGAAGLEHDELQLVFYFVEFEMRKHCAHQLPGALLQLGGSGNRKDLLAARLPHVFQDEKRQPAEVIAVQVADEQQIETVCWDATAFERRDQAGTGFHQDAAAGRVDQVAGLSTAKAPERIAGAQQSYGDGRTVRCSAIRIHCGGLCYYHRSYRANEAHGREKRNTGKRFGCETHPGFHASWVV